MRLHGLLAGAALVAAVVATSLATSFAASSAFASSGPFSLENDPVDYYTNLAFPIAPRVPLQPIFGP